MSDGATPLTRDNWAIPLTCAYCGQPVTVECHKAVGQRQVWICPAIGCARENTLANVVVVRVSKRAMVEPHVPRPANRDSL